MFSKSQLCILTFAALSTQTNGLAQTRSSRRSFIGKVAATGAAAVAVGANPGRASAVGKRGGKEMIDATHNGTPMNGKQDSVAGGLLGKMGLDDITPDKGSSYNSSYNPKGGKSSTKPPTR